jgi:glycerate kinase
MIDGGEAFAEMLVELTEGTLHAVRACGPNGKTVAAHVGFLGGADTRTAVIDIASVAGLRLFSEARLAATAEQMVRLVAASRVVRSMAGKVAKGRSRRSAG